MLSTKNIIFSVNDVPSFWAFQYYLNTEPLTGQDVKIKSIWNLGDSVPSMCIYVNKQKREYYFKDFSTGKYGNKINLVQELFKMNFSDAVTKLIADYNKFIKSGGSIINNVKPAAKWEISYIHKRDWTKSDAQYWMQYRIGKKTLTYFNVFPIEYYDMSKNDNGTISSLKIEGEAIYGYYNKADVCFKIYQPHKSRHKFHKISNYIQGLDQLNYDQRLLVICSSLKDAMCLRALNFSLEVLAPDSENTMIKPHVILNLQSKYEYIITLFDNDKAGLKAMKKYKDAYSIDGVTLPLSKDLSDSVREHGYDKVRKTLGPLIKKCINV
tara:strand:- start:60 stop:1034 length:975 start_codon:yes stop_codon:yes gene_type:complete